jgi:hypothetical protein
LQEKHDADRAQDVSDMLWPLLGSALHVVMERGETEGWISEERLFIDIEGVTLSGAIDLQQETPEGIVIVDYKFTSAWAVMNEKQDWHNQLNSYAYLVEAAKKIPVTKLQIVAIVRDWSRRDAATREGYPKAPIVVIDIPLWPYTHREAYIRDRISLHGDALFEMETDGDMPDCTPDEMWEKPTSYALKKDGNVRAKSVHETSEAAEKALADATEKAKKGEKFLIEVREGDRTRCSSFCQVAGMCSQYQKYLSTKEKSDGIPSGSSDA